jgi:hypothetical protein
MKILERTHSTPELELTDGVFMISGVCAPENAADFFEKLKQPIDDVLQSGRKYELVFKLDYFNTTSSKCLLDLFRKLGASPNRGNVSVLWFYDFDDEEMRESGEIFSELAGVDFVYRHN